MRVNKLYLDEANRIFAAIQSASIAELAESQQIDQDIQNLSIHDEDLPTGVKRQSNELQTERIARISYLISINSSSVYEPHINHQEVCERIQNEITSHALSSEELPI